MARAADSPPRRNAPRIGLSQVTRAARNEGVATTFCSPAQQSEISFGYNPEKAGEMAEWLKAAVC